MHSPCHGHSIFKVNVVSVFGPRFAVFSSFTLILLNEEEGAGSLTLIVFLISCDC